MTRYRDFNELSQAIDGSDVEIGNPVARVETPRRKTTNKYNARKTELDGHTFDSLAEAHRYAELKIMLLTDKIADLELQPRFVLQDAYTDSWGRRHRAISYTADFRYYDREQGCTIVEDVKGKAARDFSLRYKLAQAAYPHQKFEVVTT